MNRTGLAIILAGLLIAAVGTAQFILLQLTSDGTIISTQLSNSLMRYAWAIGLGVTLAGVRVGMIGDIPERRRSY